jgi:N-acylglucosamine 2-epimerase
MFSKFYNSIQNYDESKRNEWLKLAKLGAEFLRDKGKDDSGSFYFSLEKTGKPLIAPYNIFSDCFAGKKKSGYVF